MFVNRAARTMMYASFSSSTTPANWFHVVPRAGQTDASVWLGTLNGIKPHNVSISIHDADGKQVLQKSILASGWIKPLSQEAMKDTSLVDDDVIAFADQETDGDECSLAASEGESQPYINNVNLSGLTPGKIYTVEVTASAETEWNNPTTVKASFRTLPDKLGSDVDAFTVFMGSCYYTYLDDMRVAKAYEKLRKNPDYPTPDLNIFMGDQVYLDIPYQDHLWVQKSHQMRKHMVRSYADNWDSLHNIFKHANNMFTSDDHEFYNNYPYHPGHIQRLFNPVKWCATEKLAYWTSSWKISEKRWSAISKTLFRAIQTPMDRDQYQFDIGNDLSFMKVDIRVNRQPDDKSLMPKKHFDSLIKWIKTLKSPGVLVLGQPLMIHESYVGGVIDASRWFDKVLSNYDMHYNELIKTLSQSKHDIVLLSGDVHFGRIAHVPLESGKTLHEVIASPLSLIERFSDDGSDEEDLNKSRGLATISKPCGPPTYPTDVEGVKAHPVVYERCVRSKANNQEEMDADRTEEHFKTVSFSKPAGSKHIQMQVRAWMPRAQVNVTDAADNELAEEDWSDHGVTNRTQEKGPYTVKLK